jgi:predicted lipid-binding transport protein (Tim44 family)
VKERLAAKRALADLAFMAQRSPHFDWLKLRQRAQDCFARVHSAWTKADVAEASEWMTAWYWQNQQMVHLDRWEREGLRNVCNVKSVKNLRPLLFAHRNDGAEHEGSMVVVSIDAHLQDWLEERATGKVVEGSKTWKDVETLWTFTLEDGRWVVSQIEEGSLSLTYANLAKGLPPIEATLLGAPARS